MHRSRLFLFGAACFLLATANGWAISLTLGTQHFADGTSVTSVEFLNATAGEPAAFNGFQGSGDSSSNFSDSWTFSYSPADPILLPTVTIGILDDDAQASGSQLASFTMSDSVNTYDLTTALNSAFEASGGANGEYDVYTIPIPVAAYPELVGGSVTFQIALQGEGLDVLGTTASNGAGLDFSTLVLAPVPEPSSVACAACAAAAAFAGLRRRRSAAARL